jgi:hypothetical protein
MGEQIYILQTSIRPFQEGEDHLIVVMADDPDVDAASITLRIETNFPSDHYATTKGLQSAAMRMARCVLTDELARRGDGHA